MTKVQHGLTGKNATPLTRKVYAAWTDMKLRCYNQSNKFYKLYGAIGIKVQDSWLSDAGAFYKYVSSLPDFGMEVSLDRVDNNKGYEEGNLRWATPALQVRNRGKQSNNSSGTNGVTWYYNETGGTRAISWWQDGDKSKSKSFPVKKFGLLPAFAMAIEYRRQMIDNLNKQGAGYSDSHGLTKGVK